VENLLVSLKWGAQSKWVVDGFCEETVTEARGRGSKRGVPGVCYAFG